MVKLCGMPKILQQDHCIWLAPLLPKPHWYLGQVKTMGKGGELAGIQQLLDILDLRGAVITIDAGGCYKVIIEQIIEKKGDYVICLKGNQDKLTDHQMTSGY